MALELVINMQAPEPIGLNFEDLKAEIIATAERYKNLVYTDETIAEAKADRAKLNRFASALADKRRSVKADYLAEFNRFEAQIKELEAIIKEPAAIIDSQIKDYEEREKAEKEKKIRAIFEDLLFPDFVTDSLFSAKIINPRWLNKSYSLKAIRQELEQKKAAIVEEAQSLAKLPEGSFEALEYYRRTLDHAGAVTESARLLALQKAKAAEAAKCPLESTEAQNRDRVPEDNASEEAGGETKPKPAEAPQEPRRAWVSFKALLSLEEARALAAYFKANNIQFGRI